MTCLCINGCPACDGGPSGKTMTVHATIVIGYVLRSPNGKMLRWSDEVGDYFATEMQPDLFMTESQAFRVLGNAIAHCAQDEQDGFVNPVAQEMIEWLLTCKVTRLVAR